MSDETEIETIRISPRAAWNKISDLKSENAKLKEALEAWRELDTESADKNPSPCYIMRGQYRKKARTLTDAILKENP